MSLAVREDRVPNRRLREEFERRRALGWLTSHDVALRLGWLSPDGSPDVSRVLRALGIAISYNCRNGAPRKQRMLSYERAIRIAEAMNLDPVDVDL